ncbi:hypothetical protein AABB24_032727 [Solanum stoloniferum]|uniref:Uncharacterized protein n=1 Tax=Solanum stoloniferum TaxID=62892 RepID=A0ABD2RLE9_9SOLN
MLSWMMEELHSQGKTVEQIAECLKDVPLHPKTISAIQSAHDLGCDLKVVSDANQFYIETILKHHGLYRCFSEVITNPTSVDGEGRLKIFPYHDMTSFHGCNLCPPNLCKVSQHPFCYFLKLKEITDLNAQVVLWSDDEFL